MASKTSVPEQLKKALAKKERGASLAKIFDFFVEACGGERDFALLMKQEYHSAKAGSFIRQRIFQMLLQTGKFANERQGPEDDLGLLTEEDLALHAADLVQQLPQEQHEKTTIQADQESDLAAASDDAEAD